MFKLSCYGRLQLLATPIFQHEIRRPIVYKWTVFPPHTMSVETQNQTFFGVFSDFICRVQTLSTLWCFVRKVCHPIYVPPPSYGIFWCINVQHNVYFLNSVVAVNYCRKMNFLSYSNLHCTSRTYVCIILFFNTHWKNIYLDKCFKWFTLKCNVWFKRYQPCYEILMIRWFESMKIWHLLTFFICFKKYKPVQLTDLMLNNLLRWIFLTVRGWLWWKAWLCGVLLCLWMIVAYCVCTGGGVWCTLSW